jgi:hypothetical protein
MSHTEQLATTDEQKQQPARSFDSYGLVACLVISTFFIVWITLATKSLNFGSVVFLIALPWVLLRAGAIVTAAVRFPSFFALDFLLGVTVVSVAVMTWKVLVPLSLRVLLIVLLVAIASIPKLLLRHRRDPLSALGLLGVIVSLVAATGWSQDLIVPMRPVEGGIVFKPWSDYFFHATILARSLGSQTLSQVGNYEWHGFSAIFYHYASYSVALCLAKVGNLPAYETVVGFWAPFGSFLIGLASYALGRVFWSQGAGVAALVGASLIPDAGLLNVAHPLYNYFWLQHIGPGGLYGVAIAGATLILVVKGVREGRRIWIVSGVVMGALVALFKIQVFTVAFPLLLSLAILGWPPCRRSRWVVLGMSVAAGITLLPLANRFYVGPNVHFDFSGSTLYWKLLAGMASGTPVESWYQIFSTGHPFPSHVAQAIGLTMLNGLGIFAVVAPLTWLLASWHKTWQTSEGISVAAVAIFLLTTFGLSGDLRTSELIHRPFVWAYWLVASLTAGRLFSLAAERWPRAATGVVIVSVVALLWVPVRYGSGIQRGKWPRAKAYSSLRVDRGLIECAHYIRNQPPIDAIAQDSHLDPVLELGALSERRSFAARLEIWKLVSRAFRDSPYQEQLRKLESLQKVTSIPDLQRSVRETGIRWYVVHPGDPNVWPAEFRDQPAFESNGYRVYDMKRCFDLRG